MLINVLFFLTVRNSESLKTKIFVIKSRVPTSFNDSMFFKNFMPEFFDFKEPLVQKNFIMHCKNIIAKIYSEKTNEDSFKEFKSNKKKWNYLINDFIVNIEFLKSKFRVNCGLLDYLQRIELIFYDFLLKKLKSIDCLSNNNDFIENIIKKDFDSIFLLLKKMTHLRKVFHTKIKSGLFKNENTINIIEEICVFLHNIKIEKKEKIYVIILLKESYVKYLNNYNLDNTFYKNKILEEKIFDTLQSRIEFAIYKTNELYNCLKQNIIFQSKHWVLEIQEKLKYIQDIILIIFKSDFSKMKIEFFVNIYLYYNYIKENIVLKKNKLETNLFLKKFFDTAFNLDPSKLNDVLKLISIQQNILGNFIYEFCYKSYLYKFKNVACSDSQKYIFYKNFIALEKISIDYLNAKFIDINCKKVESKIICLFNVIFNNLKDFNFLYNPYLNNDFDFFKMQCFLILNLCKVFLCIQNKYMNKLNGVFYLILSELIEIIEVYISNNKVMDSKIIIKKSLLNIVLQQLKKTKMFCESIYTNKENILKIRKINGNILLTYNFNIVFYEISNAFCVQSMLDIYNSESRKTSVYTQSKTLKMNKPKTIWQNRYKTNEKNTCNIEN
ncbi:hypothetical protein NUSPORA_00555 [Nucleospora cyclopteri]